MEKEFKYRIDNTVLRFNQILQELTITSQNVIELMDKSVNDFKDKVEKSTIDPESVDMKDLFNALSPQQLLIEANHFLQQHLTVVYMQSHTLQCALICIELLSQHLNQTPKDIIDERWLWDTETDIRDEYISFVENKLDSKFEKTIPYYYDEKTEEVNS